MYSFCFMALAICPLTSELYSWFSHLADTMAMNVKTRSTAESLVIMKYYSEKFYQKSKQDNINKFRQKTCNTTMLQEKSTTFLTNIKQLQQIPTNLLYLFLGADPSSNYRIKEYIHAICQQFNLKNDEIGLEKLQNCFVNVIVVWLFVKMSEHKQETLVEIKKWFDQSQQHSDFCITLLNIIQNYQQQRNTFNLNDYLPYLGNHWHRFVLIFLQGLITSERDLLDHNKNRLVSFLHYWRNSIQDVWIKDYIVLPTHHQFTVFKLVLSLISTLEPAQLPILAHKYIDSYLKQSENQTNKVPRSHLFLHMKLIELFHTAIPNLALSPLGTNKVFMANLYECLCDFDTKGANVLGINIYGSIIRQLGRFNNQMQAFVDLYLTLDCYGMHLIKDIWDRFYVLCRHASSKSEDNNVTSEGKQYYLYSTVKLLHLVLSKVQQHSNHNVPKYCIQQLLAANPDDTCILFEQLEDTVYSSLVQILNTGTHYTDCTHFHQDSKIYKLTCMFYLGYYRRLVKQENVSKLHYHMKKLLTAMLNYISFQHCIIAYIGIFSQLGLVTQGGKQVKILGTEEVRILVALVNKFMIKLAFRKRWKFMLAVVKCLQDHANISEIGLKIMVKQVLIKLPDIFLDNRSDNLPTLYSFIAKSLSSQIPDMIKSLSQQLQVLHQQLVVHEDLSQQEHKPTLNGYFQLQKQIVILQNIQSICPDTKQQHEQPLQTLLQSTQQLSKSLYAHPLQLTANLHALAMHCKYGNVQYIVGVVKSSQASAEALLNLIGMIGTNHTFKLLSEQDILACLQVVARGIQISNSHPTCRNNAKFIQYCISQHKDGNNSQYYLTLLINSLKFKLQYCHTYKAIEDSLYKLYENLHTELVGVSPKYLLRVQILLFCILTNDFDYGWQTISNSKWAYVADLREYCNTYDYDFYDEFFNFCGAVANLLQKAHKKGKLEEDKWQQYKQTVFGHLIEAVKSMIYNLEYGVHKKEVVSSTENVVKIAIIAGFNKESLKLIDFMLEVGQKYWGFHRNTVLLALKQMHKTTKIEELKQGFKYLIGKFICIEEYRGQDSAILLSEHNDLPVYSQKQLHPESDYDGTAIRFATIEWSQNELNLLVQNPQQTKINVWMEIFEQCFGVCMSDNSRERMFMTGTHLAKVKYCQFIMIFPQFLRQYCSQQLYSQIIMRCVDSMNLNNLIQIRHYIETFMLKLIYLNPTHQLLSNICIKLSKQLLQIEGQSTLFKNVSYIMISGFVLQLCYNHDLFSALFCCVCSHISYYRGLSQYFCYRMIEEVKKSNMKDAKYMIMLYQQFLKDEDAIRLTNRLDKMVENFKNLVLNWNIQEHLFKLKPTLNGQVVSDEHYIDKLKHFGQELIKDHKHEDGFMPYRQAWKRIIKDNQQLIALNQQQNLNSFQRKIDPSLDDLYNFEPLQQQKAAKNELKIFVVSAQQIALYGHLARVGEILGISELCIPNKNITQMEEFSNVSVTAEKWLNITQHKFEIVKKLKGKVKQVAEKKKQGKQNKKLEKQVIEEEIIEMGREIMLEIIKKHKEEGYKVYLIKKGRNIQRSREVQYQKKALIIIDELGLAKEVENMADFYVSFNHYYSYHVQATVFMWEYFKTFCLDNTAK